MRTSTFGVRTSTFGVRTLASAAAAFAAAAGAIATMVEEATPQALATMVWAFAERNQRDLALFDAAAGAAHRMLTDQGHHEGLSPGRRMYDVRERESLYFSPWLRVAWVEDRRVDSVCARVLCRCGAQQFLYIE